MLSFSSVCANCRPFLQHHLTFMICFFEPNASLFIWKFIWKIDFVFEFDQCMFNLSFLMFNHDWKFYLSMSFKIECLCVFHGRNSNSNQTLGLCWKSTNIKCWRNLGICSKYWPNSLIFSLLLYCTWKVRVNEIYSDLSHTSPWPHAPRPLSKLTKWTKENIENKSKGFILVETDLQ